MFGVVVFLQMFLAIGYGNNLIFLLTFGLIGMGFSSMYFTNENIRKLKMGSLESETFYAEETNNLWVSFELRDRRPAHFLEFSTASGAGELSVKTDRLQDGDRVAIPWRPTERGRRRLPRISVKSDFPFGLLRSWKRFVFYKTVVVYPCRRGDPRFPASARPEGGASHFGEFRDHRKFQSTDSPRRIDWRVTAKYRDLMVKNFESDEDSSLRFSWSQTAHLGSYEDRISQLSLWVSLAHEQGLSYSLQLSRRFAPEGRGESHFRSCMEALAFAERAATP